MKTETHITNAARDAGRGTIKHAFTQDELRRFVDSGETVLLSYRTAGVLEWSRGVEAVVVRLFRRKSYGQPFTLRGRVMLCAPAYYQRLVDNESV